ncbi:MAG TPA: polymer-forming cytoskeletal protein [Terriglobia bacterium]|nr:polymer-forming cytoskeletal protein [Terriglobia bacterium]
MSESLKKQETVLGEGTEFEGAIRSQCPITVSGNLQGNVSAPTLIVTRTGSVHGHIKVAEVKSEGEIAGEIDAESVDLSGHVGDQTTIRATSLQVKLSQNGAGGKLQVSFGNCDVRVGTPAKPPIEQPKPFGQNDKKEKPEPVSPTLKVQDVRTVADITPKGS